MTDIDWDQRQRPRKFEKGHTAVRFGYRHLGFRDYRLYVECQCGKIYSRRTSESYSEVIHYAHTRHQRKMGVVD